MDLCSPANKKVLSKPPAKQEFSFTCIAKGYMYFF